MPDKIPHSEKYTKNNRFKTEHDAQQALSSSLEAEEITGPIAGPMIDLEKAMDKAEKDRYEIRMVDVALEAVTLEATAKRSEYYPRFLLKEGIITFAINMLFMTAPGLSWVE